MQNFSLDPFIPADVVPFDSIIAARAASGIDLESAVPAGLYAAPVRRRVMRATIMRVIAWTLALVAGISAYAWITAGVFTAITYAGATVAGFIILAGWMLLTGALVVAFFVWYSNRI